MYNIVVCPAPPPISNHPSPAPPPSQYSLPLELLNDVTMPGWMAAVEGVVSRPIPVECRKVPEEEQLNTEWWKAKKWATRVLWRIFEQLVKVNCITTVAVLGNYNNMYVAQNAFCTCLHLVCYLIWYVCQ